MGEVLGPSQRDLERMAKKAETGAEKRETKDIDSVAPCPVEGDYFVTKTAEFPDPNGGDMVVYVRAGMPKPGVPNTFHCPVLEILFKQAQGEITTVSDLVRVNCLDPQRRCGHGVYAWSERQPVLPPAPQQ